ncbi:hypothetical protein PLEOSDRAFT_154569 [Pleurotus ostreatus PC15]|uniref:Uncharacterized protein n=1 Tax=Pleurotus ostreatus (strain PC15) TaxID=1137138 RepID=A0A067NWZ3_PLEO1|nr:hypothetical protein PLEOSDRAFT_154569 [Pleurotus ostreatus PC15]
MDSVSKPQRSGTRGCGLGMWPAFAGWDGGMEIPQRCLRRMGVLYRDRGQRVYQNDSNFILPSPHSLSTCPCPSLYAQSFPASSSSVVSSTIPARFSQSLKPLPP